VRRAITVQHRIFSPPPAHPVALRIIGGCWRGRIIRAARGMGLRPSGGRVRESLFNCLGQRLHGLSCLDLFAGSGVLGLEAASRGARRVIFVEKHAATAVKICRYVNELNAPATVMQMTAERFLAKTEDFFDLVFLDPPFAMCPSDSDWACLLAAVIPAL